MECWEAPACRSTPNPEPELWGLRGAEQGPAAPSILGIDPCLRGRP